jgi:hypothetical protein
VTEWRSAVRRSAPSRVLRTAQTRIVTERVAEGGHDTFVAAAFGVISRPFAPAPSRLVKRGGGEGGRLALTTADLQVCSLHLFLAACMCCSPSATSRFPPFWSSLALSRLRSPLCSLLPRATHTHTHTHTHTYTHTHTRGNPMGTLRQLQKCFHGWMKLSLLFLPSLSHRCRPAVAVSSEKKAQFVRRKKPDTIRRLDVMNTRMREDSPLP